MILISKIIVYDRLIGYNHESTSKVFVLVHLENPE